MLPGTIFWQRTIVAWIHFGHVRWSPKWSQASSISRRQSNNFGRFSGLSAFVRSSVIGYNVSLQVALKQRHAWQNSRGLCQSSTQSDAVMRIEEAVILTLQFRGLSTSSTRSERAIVFQGQNRQAVRWFLLSPSIPRNLQGKFQAPKRSSLLDGKQCRHRARQCGSQGMLVCKPWSGISVTWKLLGKMPQKPTQHHPQLGGLVTKPFHWHLRVLTHSWKSSRGKSKAWLHWLSSEMILKFRNTSRAWLLALRSITSEPLPTCIAIISLAKTWLMVTSSRILWLQQSWRRQFLLWDVMLCIVDFATRSIVSKLDKFHPFGRSCPRRAVCCSLSPASSWSLHDRF